ncbi:MAG: S41 family peptidase [Krumholzibacteria bacterium]|nr:S41 family peptidase [Candidatus Krumholzibacteria bacterium]
MTSSDSPAPRGRLVRPRFLALLGLALVLGATVTAVRATDDPQQRRRDKYENLKILSEVYDKILENYVDVMDPKEVMEAAVQGMLDELDEHSNYLPPVNYEDLMMSTEGEFGGLGITINIRDHFPTVVSPIEGTPAYYMGIQGGDQIVEIEGESAYDFTSQAAVKKLRGPRGTKVNITVKRPGVAEPIPYTITRDIIKIESVPYAFMMGDIGYVRVQNFARTTADELRAKLDQLTAQGMKGLILDLRFNPGGLLGAAQAVSELFLPRDQLIVFTKGRLAEQNQSYYSRTRGKVYDQVPMIVMINNSSASASEIVAAAIQDHDAGLVVGRDSFGKGSVQTVFRLDEDEALKLTTARYYTPSGRSIHKEQRMDEADAFAEDEMPEGHPGLAPAPEVLEIPRSAREQFRTDSGRVVYGGGGITPDIEITQDFLTDFEVAVERDGALFSWAVEFANAHAQAGVDWRPSDRDFNGFKEFLRERENIDEYLEVFELAMSDSLLDANRAYLERGLRREVARRLHGPQAAYQVAIEADTQLHEALQLFRQAGTLPELFAAAEKWNEEHLKQLAAEDAGKTDKAGTTAN